MNKDNAVRQINRTLQQYYDTFGADSAEYQNLLRDVEYNLGDTTRTQKGGAAAYSRSAHTLAGMDVDSLETAKGLTIGENSVNRKKQEVAEELESAGIEADDEAIREYSKMKKSASDWYHTIYKMLSEQDERYKSLFAGSDIDSQDDLVNKLSRIVGGRDNIADTINRARQWESEKEDRIKEHARNTPKQKLAPREGMNLRRKSQGIRKGYIAKGKKGIR